MVLKTTWKDHCTLSGNSVVKFGLGSGTPLGARPHPRSRSQMGYTWRPPLCLLGLPAPERMVLGGGAAVASHRWARPCALLSADGGRPPLLLQGRAHGATGPAPETAPGPAPAEARHLSLNLEFCDWRRWGRRERERELRDKERFGGMSLHDDAERELRDKVRFGERDLRAHDAGGS